MAREFDLDLLPDIAAPQKEGLPPGRKGGRPAGKDGEPIARVTLRMSTKSPGGLQRSTANAIGVELIEKYLNQGLDPPSGPNACRSAAGILRAVRG
jgi:hypothetical protein